MKLEVENPSSLHLNGKVANFSADANPASDLVEMLSHGIRSAQAGNRSEARTALFKVTELDPANESAWLWLASISEYPEELLVFLKNVLDINPSNNRAMEWKTATNSLLAKTFVQRGIDAVEGSRKEFAAECFNRALEYDQNNEMAWLWMASLSETNEGKINYLEMVLKIDPNNEAAIQAFAKAKTEITTAHLAEAKSAAALGRKAEANELLNAVIEEDPNCEDAWMLRSHFADTFEEKIASFNAVLRINPDNAAARYGLDSLESLIGSCPAVENKVSPAIVKDDSIGSISGSNLFVYEPEIHRNPTQDLEFPEEKLEELREFEARAETVHTVEVDSVEQPVSGYIEQPVAEFVEQPVSLEEQNEITEVEVESESDTTVEFEVAAVDVPEIQENSEPETTDLDEATESADFAENVLFVANPIDNDRTISISTPESYASADSKTTEFNFEEDLNREVSPVEFVDTSEFAFSAVNPDEESGPFWEPYVHEDSVAETAAAGESHSEEAAYANAAKTEEIPSAINEFHSEQIVIPVSADRDETTDFADTSDEGDDPFRTVASIAIPMPDSAAHEAKPENDPFATTGEPQYVRSAVASPAPSVSNCSFCGAVNESSSISCHSCLAVLTLSDLDMIIGSRADRSVLKAAVERMENDHLHREFDESELTMLGIGHLNLQNIQFGYNYLYEASKLNPNNVVLSSQVNALLIRLEDIRKHDENAETMCKGKTILVVDDSPTVRKLIAGKLEKSGHKVFCSADGVEAIEVLAETKPDLILLDISMPRMDGYQTCKAIRANDATKSVPVVMISGKDGFFDKVRGRMAGTSGYITKPFGPETLMKTVETFLSGNGENNPDMDSDAEIEA
jgi:CheY-like chemotaxis protein/Tfp pilus assembly protein PilF